jgi:DNA-binding MarR family transcriptional regulator
MDTSSNEKQLREMIRILERKLGLLEDAGLSCCPISFTQCHAMIEIGRAGNISLIDLAGKLNLDNSTMSRTVNNLVNSSLAERETDPMDRRYVTIKLTEEGKNQFAAIEDSMGSYYSRIYKNIPEAKREQVLESIDLLINAIEHGDCC